MMSSNHNHIVLVPTRGAGEITIDCGGELGLLAIGAGRAIVLSNATLEAHPGLAAAIADGRIASRRATDTEAPGPA